MAIGGQCGGELRRGSSGRRRRRAAAGTAEGGRAGDGGLAMAEGHHYLA